MDYVAETNTLISSLKLEGLVVEAGKLQEAMDAASTGGELIDRVKFELETMSGNPISETAKARIRKLLQGIIEFRK